MHTNHPNAIAVRSKPCLAYDSRNKSKLLFFKLKNRLGLARSKSSSGVQSRCSVFLILGGVTMLNPVPALIPLLSLNMDRVGDASVRL
jgi:hypothetical protein